MPLTEKTWLVQRLTRPWEKKFPEKGFELDKEGKFTEDSIDRRQGVCGYDYMGSAEFEFGTIPAAVRGFYQGRDSLATYELPVEAKDIRVGFNTRKLVAKDTTFYVICRKGDEEEVTKRIRTILVDTMPLKERPHVYDIFDHENLSRVWGWFELNNGFYFFADKEMFEGMFFMYTGRKP